MVLSMLDWRLRSKFWIFHCLLFGTVDSHQKYSHTKRQKILVVFLSAFIVLNKTFRRISIVLGCRQGSTNAPWDESWGLWLKCGYWTKTWRCTHDAPSIPPPVFKIVPYRWCLFLRSVVIFLRYDIRKLGDQKLGDSEQSTKDGGNWVKSEFDFIIILEKVW